MIQFCSLYSGSSGNCYYIDVDGTKILLDVGKSAKKIIEGINFIGEDISSIDAIIISHEHSDHISGLKTITKKRDMEIYISNKTEEEAEKYLENVEAKKIINFKTGSEFKIGNATIKSVPVSHDAIDPSMFTIKDIKGNKIAIFTDVGVITDIIKEEIKNSKLAVIEANYEKSIIEVSKYPYYLKRRIMGKYGHLSNEEGAILARHAVENGTKYILLGHLSKENNTEKIAYQTVLNNIEDIYEEYEVHLDVASRENPGEKYTIE